MKKTQKKPTDEALATLMVDRQERVLRAAKAFEEISKKERVTLVVSSLNLSPEGKVSPVIQIMPID
jgi:hypothetical protein